MLPIVLYNGKHRWQAATEFSSLIDPATPELLRSYQPELRYVLIDEGRYDPKELANYRNLAAAIFRLELARTPAEIEPVVRELVQWLKAPEQRELRRTVTKWLIRLVRRQVHPAEVPEVEDLLEVETMLSERIGSWTKELLRQGIKETELLGKRVEAASTLRRLLTKRF